MSDKLKIKWTKPPKEYLAKEGLTMTMNNVNVIWHDENDVEVTQFFEYPLPKSERVKKTLCLGISKTRNLPLSLILINGSPPILILVIRARESCTCSTLI